MSAKDDPGDHGNHHTSHHKLYRRLFVGALGFVVLVLLVVLVVWLVLRPTKPTFSLQDASVLALNLPGAGGSLLTLTLQVTLSTRNPNDRVGVYYDRLDVYAAYHNQQVTLATAIPPVYQGHGDVVVWSPFLYGAGVPVAPYVTLSLEQDRAAGLLLLHVRVQGRLRWKVGSWISGQYHISATCPALLAFNRRGGGADVGSGGGFSPVIRFQQVSTCSVDV